jgi:hypothetical protein
MFGEKIATVSNLEYAFVCAVFHRYSFLFCAPFIGFVFDFQEGLVAGEVGSYSDFLAC